jgi:hypothetical protein
MNSEDKFWAYIWSIAASVLIAAMVFGTVSSDLERKTMLEMVSKGANPMEVSCAFNVGQNDISICTILANKEKK